MECTVNSDIEEIKTTKRNTLLLREVTRDGLLYGEVQDFAFWMTAIGHESKKKCR